MKYFCPFKEHLQGYLMTNNLQVEFEVEFYWDKFIPSEYTNLK